MLVEVSGRAVSRAYRRSGSSSNTVTHQHQHQPKHLGVSCLSQVSSESRLSSRSSWSRRNRAALCRKVLGQGLTTDDPSWGSNTSRGDSRVSVWSPSSWPYIRSRSVPRYTEPRGIFWDCLRYKRHHKGQSGLHITNGHVNVNAARGCMHGT